MEESKRKSAISTFFKRIDKKINSLKKKNVRATEKKASHLPCIDYTSLFHAGNIVAFVLLPEEGWPVAYVTENVKSLLGFSDEEMMNENLFFKDMIHPDDIERIQKEVIDNQKKHKEYYEQKYRIRNSDGDYIWIRDYSVPVWDHDQITQINGYMYNITAEIEAEDILNINNQRLSNVIEATNAGIWEWNLQTDLVQCNEKHAGIMGYQLEEIEPYSLKMWEESLHPDDLYRFRTVVREYLDGRRDSYNIECRVKHKNGHWIWLHSIGKIIERDDQGEPLLMIGSQVEVTHRKESEAMMSHSEKLSALGRLCGGISHDMNNQLMKIRGTAEMAKIWDSKDHYRSSLDTIETVCDSASWIINQLMVFSGNNIYQPEISDLGKILWELSELLDHTFEKEIIVISDISNEKMIISADQSLLKKAFFNICFNAKEALPHGGKLKISLTKTIMEKKFVTSTGDLEPGKYGRVDFSDEGSGIDESEIDKIFEPFYTTKDFGSQGLGLAKVVSVVKEHNGGIQVKSSKDEGSVFSIFLPLEEQEIVEIESGPEKLYFKTSATREILIIDDEKMICELLSMYFSEMNWDSKYFTNPLEGLEYFKENKNKIGLVILDKFMPEINGDQVFKELVSINDKSRILFISGFIQDIEEYKNNKENIAGFLKKPVKLDDLKKIIKDEFSL